MSGDRSHGTISGIETSRRRRRPSGEPPPLPRPAWWPRLAIVLGATIVVGILLGYAYENGPLDAAMLDWLTGFRAAWVVNLSEALSWFGTATGILVLRLALAIVLIVFRRWRHLAVTLGAFVIFDALVVSLVRFDLPTPDVDVIVAPASGVYYFPASGVAS